MTKKLNTQDVKLERKNKLTKFAQENLKLTSQSTSASVIEKFATLIHDWLQAEYMGKGINPELIVEQIYDMAKYKGQVKNDFGIITHERNTTFEKNVSRSYMIAEIWYFKEQDSETLNTTKSDYLYFKNGVLVGSTKYHKVDQAYEKDMARLSLEGIKDFHRKVFTPDSDGASKQKSLLRKVHGLNEETFNKLIKAFVRTPSAKDQKQGNKELSFDYDKLAETSQQDFELIIEASQDFLKTITFFQGLINFVNDENNMDMKDADNVTVQATKAQQTEHLKVIENLQATITKYSTPAIHDNGIDQATDTSKVA